MITSDKGTHFGNRKISILFLMLSCLSLDLSAQAVIETVAGGKSGFEFDPLALPLSSDSIVIDPIGSLYFTSRNMVLKLDTATGKLQRIAGNGSSGFSGDGGLAVDANLDGPSGLVLITGNLFIADYQNQRIRKVDAAGVITTVAGNGTSGFAGDGGRAVDARLDSPTGLAADSRGNLFIADTRNGRIRKVDAAGVITTVAGNGTWVFSGDGGQALGASLSFPLGVAVDTTGNLFIADTSNSRIRKVDAAGVITTVAGNGTTDFSGDGGPAINASLDEPQSIAVDKEGNLFIADSHNQRIRKVDAAGVITTIAGSSTHGFSGDGGSAINASLSAPTSVAVGTAGNVFLADSDNDRIRQVNRFGVITTVAGGGTEGLAVHTPTFSGDGGPSADAILSEVSGLALNAEQNLFIADDQGNRRVRKITSSGVITTVAGNGLNFDDGSRSDGGPALTTSLGSVDGVAVDSAGNLFIGDGYVARIRKVNTSGTITTIPAEHLASPTDLTFDAAGNLIIATISGIFKIDSAGILKDVAGVGIYGFAGDGGPAVTASLNGPEGVGADGVGNLYIADRGNHRIRKVDRAGVISTVAGNGAGGALGGFGGDGGLAVNASLALPGDVTVDADGNLFIADTFNNRIRKVNRAGVITTIAGTGVAGFSGDGGAPEQARLNHPTEVALDIAGNLFIADTNNRRIRRVRFSSGPTGTLSVVNAASGTQGSSSPSAIISIYGQGLAAALEVANGGVESLGGTSVEINHSAGGKTMCGLYFVSPAQINCVVATGAGVGAATVNVRRNGVAVGTSNIQIAAVSPALFSANASGQGVAAAVALVVPGAGPQSSYTVARYDAAVGRSVPVPIALGSPGDQVYLLLFGTGIRGFRNLSEISVSIGGASVPVLGAAAQSEFPGLDQVNVGPLPRSLAGRGEVGIVLTVDGKPANTVTVSIR